MKNFRIIVIAAVLAVLSFWLQREFLRGTFDPVESGFAGWLAANTSAREALPPLVVVLYDEESSALAGATRMAVLDGALFVRAAAKLGALAAGIEGLRGNPARMLEAAGRMPVFGGFEIAAPPDNGWTPCAGAVGDDWAELPGLAGPSAARFPRGFFAPPAGAVGPRSIGLVARHADRPVPSFLAMAWAAGQRLRSSDMTAAPGRLEGQGRMLPLDAGGSACFFAEDEAQVMSMNDLLVAAEKFEREGGVSPLHGSIVVLCRATADVSRVKAGADADALTPAELWAQGWSALRKGRFFLLPEWWYPLLPALAAVALCLGPSRRRWGAVLATGLLAVLAYLLIALGVFATFGLLLPLVPSAATLLAGLLLGQFRAQRTGSDAP